MANRPCTQVGDGYTAIEGAHKDLDRISNLSGQIPSSVSNILMLVMGGSPEEIKLLLHDQLQGVLHLASTCQNAASECEQFFANVSGLAQVGSFRKIYSSNNLFSPNTLPLRNWFLLALTRFFPLKRYIAYRNADRSLS
jgi:hypothetical protein